MRNQYGQVVLSSHQLRELLLEGRPITHLVVQSDEDIRLFQQYQSDLLKQQVTFMEPQSSELSVSEFHEQCAAQWIIPDKYHNVDIHSWALSKCKTDEQRARVELEYKMFSSRNLVMLLRMFVYMVDHFRETGVVWGVGRGSSVNSYLLYLIGVHRVDSVKYKLDINDYLRED